MMPEQAMPGMVGFEHVSTTVPDLEQALEFFVGVLGARLARRTSFSAPPGSLDMVEHFNAHRDASADLAILDLHGTVIELFEYHAPDLSSQMPRNCDAGGHHLGFRVDDVDLATAYLRQIPGVRVLGEPTYVDGEHERRGWIYFLTPWGLQLEIASSSPPTRPAAYSTTETGHERP
jgi:catechol 2,3-dioxygenase-like lactoylglutathione lyase family enzyme